MDSLKFELAADYLVMAATLAEIKSRLMLPKESFDEEEDDPRAALITKDELFSVITEIINRPNYKLNHQIDFEELSTKERIQILLNLLSRTNIISFSKTLRKPEGRKGVVVTLLASLELAKDGYIELIQNKSEELFIKSSRGSSLWL